MGFGHNGGVGLWSQWLGYGFGGSCYDCDLFVSWSCGGSAYLAVMGFCFFGLCSCWWLWLGCDVGVVSGRCGGFGSGCGFGDDWVVDLGVDFREEKDRERERENKK